MGIRDSITRRNLFAAFATLAASRDSAGASRSALGDGAASASPGASSSPRMASLDGMPLSEARNFTSVFEIAGAHIETGVTHLRTAGYKTAGDGGGALYRRVAVEPIHAGKAQSADGAFWELVPSMGEWAAEQFGAVGGGTSDDLGALNDALSATVATRNTLVARGAYLISDTLTFPTGRYGFKGPDYRQPGTGMDRGFIWGGGDDKPIVEFLQWTDSRCEGLIVTNSSSLSSKASGVTGVLAHNPDGKAASITNCHFEFISIYGCHVGLQIGDYTNDGYDSNWEQNVVENVHFYDVANPLIVDSNNQDNLIFKTFHNGGPLNLSNHVGRRNHIIHIKRSGHGHKFDYIFARIDELKKDNAAIRIEDGSFSCDFCSLEGADSVRILDIEPGVLTRSQSMIRQMTGTDAQRDSRGRSMVLAGRTGATLIGCCVGGAIECNSQVTAINTLFRDGAGFTGSALAGVVHVNTQSRSDSGAAISSSSPRIGYGAIPVRREAAFRSEAVNAGSFNAGSQRLDVGSMAVWRIAQRSADGLTGIWRVYILHDPDSTFSYHVEKILDTAGSTTVTIIARGATYSIVIANHAAFDGYYSGWLENHDVFDG